MKQIAILLSITTITFGLHAQDKGFLSGRLSIDNSSVSGVSGSTTLITCGPQVGFNLSDRIIVGLGIDYSGTTVSSKQTSGNQTFDLKDKFNLFTASPFLRYMKRIDEDFQLYGQFQFGVGFGKEESEHVGVVNGSPGVTSAKVDISDFYMAIGPGLAFNFAPHWAATADWGALHFDSRSTKPDVQGADDITTNTFGLALTPASISLALNWLF